MNDEPTIPPHRPNTPRTWILKAWEAIQAHPDRALMFGLGFLMALLLAWIF